jgi:hypothetical protein
VQSWTNTRFGVTFRCSSCHEGLRIPLSYTRKGSVTSLVLSLGFTYLSGVRGYGLVVLPVVLFFVCASVISTITRYLFPQNLELVSDR